MVTFIALAVNKFSEGRDAMPKDRRSRPRRRPVQLPVDDHQRVKVIAARRGISMGELVVLAVDAMEAAEAKASRAKAQKRPRALSA